METKEYGIIDVGGHILVRDDRGSVVLIDTGSPGSFHKDGVVALGGEIFEVPASMTTVDSGYISEKIGACVDGLAGMDILGGGLLVDVPGGRVVVGSRPGGKTRLPSGTILGCVTVEMEILGRRVKAVIDTGAPVSYVMPSLTRGLAPVGHVADFNPAVPGGTFETDVFEFGASFAGEEFTMRAGHLPGHFAMALSLIGADAVVGMELLKRFPVLFHDGGIWV